MNLRCIYCQTPFTLSRAEMLGAIVHMNEKNQNHYDAHCPRCRRANSISRQRMELFFPNWREAAKQQASAPAVPVPSAGPSPTSAAAMLKTEPITKAKRVEAGRAAAKSTAKKQVAAVAKKPAAKKTSPAKPAARKAPAKGRKK